MSNTDTDQAQPRRIVVFADGTGNAFTMQESNVWRLYQALDQSSPDQIADYIPGVGTSSFRPFALLDGATGIGVPANVRKLYKFICWNWKPGDEIYMFGFSRGAFTIRTLVGLIDHEGLVPARIGEHPVSHVEMNRHAMAAWRAYRSKTATRRDTLPTIWLARFVRNLLIAARDRAMRYRRYSSIAAETRNQKRDSVPIAFLGLFDTVEAYGVPLEEFRRAIDIAIWPISFRNRILSPLVQRARHALSLDDERTTFHPVRFDRVRSKAPERIGEVWFAGVHSDVGGGYPDSNLAFVPLAWMANEVTQRRRPDGTLAQGLRFAADSLASFDDQASPYAPVHDSRSGLAVFYRYGPREVGDNAGPPLVHHSVAEKISFGTEGYAPVTLPSTAHVLMPDGTTHQIFGFRRNQLAAPDQQAIAAAAVENLSNPDGAIVAVTLDCVWWRRVAYFSLLFAAALVASLPLTAIPISNGFRDAVGWMAARVGLGPAWDAAWRWMANADQGGAALVGIVIQYVGTLLPGYAKPYADALIARPTTCTLVVLLAALLYLKNSRLRDRIADLARVAWLSPIRKARAHDFSAERLQRPTLTYRIRTSRLAAFLENAVAGYLVPTIGIVLIYGLIAVGAVRSTVIYRDGSGAICRDSPQLVSIAPGETVSRSDFTTDQLCWGSGVLLAKGHHYRLWIDMKDPYFDQTILSGIDGFKNAPFPLLAGWPLRRSWAGDWFQPIARIGTTGDTAWLLAADSGDVALPAGENAKGEQIPARYYDAPEFAAWLTELKSTGRPPPADPRRLTIAQKLPASDLQVANMIWEKYLTRRTMVSSFVASESGELFLYVNDAIAAVPFGPTVTAFYDNNSGSATIVVEEIAAPALPAR